MDDRQQQQQPSSSSTSSVYQSTHNLLNQPIFRLSSPNFPTRTNSSHSLLQPQQQHSRLNTGWSSSNSSSNSIHHFRHTPISTPPHQHQRSQQQQQQQPSSSSSTQQQQQPLSSHYNINIPSFSSLYPDSRPSSFSPHSNISQTNLHQQPGHRRPLLVPQPTRLATPDQHRRPSGFLNQLHHSLEFFDRPDSRSSSQSHSTALPPQPINTNLLSSSSSSPQKFTIPSNRTTIPPLGLHIWSEEWPREWSWTGIHIPVKGVRALRDQIERISPTTNSSHPTTAGAALREDHDDNLDQDEHALELDGTNETNNSGLGEVLSCMFSNDRWKVEVVKGYHRKLSAPPTPTGTTAEDQNDQLSLYLTCHELDVDWPTSRSISTSVLVSIKEPRIPASLDPITDLGSVSEGWLWRVCCEERRFEKENEVWECHTFPSLSSLLENPRVAMYDSFILSVQIGTPSTAAIPQIPQSTFVPHSLLESIESLLDDQNTADLQILVTETCQADPTLSTSNSSEQMNSQQDQQPQFSQKYRRRLLYAHSSVLKTRSEYFKTMLTDESLGGGWAESGQVRNQDSRKLGLIKIDDFDFVTIYWLLRWLYSNRIFFTEQEDVRAQCHLGSSINQVIYPFDSLPSNANPWGWKTFKTTEEDLGEGSDHAHSEKATDVLETVSESGIDPNSIVGGTRRLALSPSSPSGNLRGARFARGSANVTGKRRPISGNGSPSSSLAFKSLKDRSSTRSNKEVGFSHLTRSTNPTSPNRSTEPTATAKNEANSKNEEPRLSWLAGEPHSHPIDITTKASALSIYRLAHRYELKQLERCAMTHLISNLTPSSAFPLLLASFVFPELHSEIKAYCLSNYYLILQEEEFRRCYSEVGDGLWEHGGEVLLSFTMNLAPGPTGLIW